VAPACLMADMLVATFAVTEASICKCMKQTSSRAHTCRYHLARLKLTFVGLTSSKHSPAPVAPQSSGKKPGKAVMRNVQAAIVEEQAAAKTRMAQLKADALEKARLRAVRHSPLAPSLPSSLFPLSSCVPVCLSIYGQVAHVCASCCQMV
jgi:hypothetical protein